MNFNRIDVGRLLFLLDYEGEVRGSQVVSRCRSGNHADRNPSWNIALSGPNKGLFYCFSCHWSGDLIDLVMHERGMSFEEAKAFLTNLEKENKALPLKVKYSPKSPTAGGMEMPGEVLFPNFGDWVDGPKNYILSRGITPEQVARWRIGYAVDGRLEGRIVIPVYGKGGELLSYTARTFVGAEKRYLMPNANERPSLGAIFGEQHWEGRDILYVAEGAINALAIERCTKGDVAALMGSKVSSSHLLKLRAYEIIIVATDPDPAGDAAWDVLCSCLGSRSNLVRANMPPGRDAAEISPQELSSILRGCQRLGSIN